MKKIRKKWKIFAIHHSHTDIGYTDRQEKIEQYHVGFIRQALQISKDIQSGKRKDLAGFKWVCETFWAVERFLEQSSDEERHEFAEAVRRGDIELSGTYLNMTELADYDILRSISAKAAEYGRSIGYQVDSAMTADINGYSWGYAQSMLDAGISHLFSCVHTHHGMFPLGRKQIPFWWETPSGDKLLVWNGDHYFMGNELALCPDAVGSYMIRDEFVTPAIVDNQMEIAETRINRYLNLLEEEEYPYDFVPVMVSGLATDNGSPNGKIMEFINQWNERFGEEIEVQMTTLSQFFNHLKQQSAEIPVYRGDWPDWWSDGVSSTALHTQVFRDGQRTLRKVKQLDPKQEIIGKPELSEIEYQLVMYAEHTWGFHTSVNEPWHPNVQLLEVRKQAYAAEASRLAYRALDKVLLQHGETLLYPERPFHYRVVNTEKRKTSQLVDLAWNGFENELFKNGLEVVEESSQQVIVHQRKGELVSIEVELNASENKQYSIRPVHSVAARTTNNFKLVGADTIYDLEDMYPNGGAKEPILFTQQSVESPYVKISWNEGEGIVSWFNKETDTEMIRSDRQHGAFTPVYEMTPDRSERGRMGRNRKGINVRRSAGQIIRAREVTKGPLYGIVELQYESKGMSYFSLFLKLYSTMNRVDVSVRFHKDSVWEPENVYLSLPFTNGNQQEETLWFEKSGALIRPWVDQLPGTCLDYYCIQEGMAYVTADRALAISTPDTPLMQLGSLEYGKRQLHGQQAEDADCHLYAWILSNYWETNFKATLGGFYEFKYYVESGNHMTSPEQAIDHCYAMNSGFTCYRISE